MIEIRPMDESYLHLGCLHGGPVDTATVQPPPEDSEVDLPPRPWSNETLAKLAARYPDEFPCLKHVELFREMIDRYGTCAILAWEGQKVVGHLRFNPMAVVRLFDPEQAEACSVVDGTARGPEEDKETLSVHCVMTGRPYVARRSRPIMDAVVPEASGPAVIVKESGQRRYRSVEESGARKGTGLKLVHGLISWAGEHGWKRIVKQAHPDLDCFYGICGGGGKAFWEKAGFEAVGTVVKLPPPWTGYWADIVERQRKEKGMTEEEAWTWYIMAYEL